MKRFWQIFLVCAVAALLCVLAALPLHCLEKAIIVGGAMFLEGGIFGTALALVTRTRRPIAIYLWLGVALLTLWPLIMGWPPAGAWDVQPVRPLPSLFYNYFDVLRFLMFLLGLPAPFAGFGNHAPDSLPPETSGAERNEQT